MDETGDEVELEVVCFRDPHNEAYVLARRPRNAASEIVTVWVDDMQPIEQIRVAESPQSLKSEPGERSFLLLGAFSTMVVSWAVHASKLNLRSAACFD